MIQANELRLGNIIGMNHRDHPGQTVEKVVDCTVLNLIAGYVPTPVDMKAIEFVPIKLTEEILLKCGAVKFQHKIFTNYLELPLKRNKKIVISDIGTPNFMMGIVECNFETGQVEDVVNVHNWDFEKDMYLHLFQNIYFSHTVKELEIKF